MTSRRTSAHRRGPLSDYTLGGIKTVLELYDKRRLTLQAAVDEIATLVGREPGG